MHVEHRLSTEVADARLDRQTSIGLDDEQTVKSRGASGVNACRDANAANFRAHAFATSRFSLLPLEQFGSSIQRLFHEGTRRIRALAPRIGRTERRFPFRSV